MTPIFLTAEWRHLVMLNFAIEPSRLQSLVPRGTEIDVSDGTAYVSLVGFRFLDTRVKGFTIPFFRDFDEINLRFYVRRRGPEGWRRGVVFIREIVPKRAIAATAHLVYNEPYVTRRTRSAVNELRGPQPGSVEYAWKDRGRWMKIGARYGGPSAPPAWNEHVEQITMNHWGYTRQRDGGTIEYHVEHPRWRVFEGRDVTLDGDLAGFYGSPAGEVLATPPRSVLVAEGSAVVVRQGERLT
jgi:uncharacterized protein YqjF (DUF2071 family)